MNSASEINVPDSNDHEREISEAAREIGLAALDIARALLHGRRLDEPGLRNSLREFHVGLGMALAELETRADP